MTQPAVIDHDTFYEGDGAAHRNGIDATITFDSDVLSALRATVRGNGFVEIAVTDTGLHVAHGDAGNTSQRNLAVAPSRLTSRIIGEPGYAVFPGQTFRGALDACHHADAGHDDPKYRLSATTNRDHELVHVGYADDPYGATLDIEDRVQTWQGEPPTLNPVEFVDDDTASLSFSSPYGVDEAYGLVAPTGENDIAELYCDDHCGYVTLGAGASRRKLDVDSSTGSAHEWFEGARFVDAIRTTARVSPNHTIYISPDGPAIITASRDGIRLNTVLAPKTQEEKDALHRTADQYRGVPA